MSQKVREETYREDELRRTLEEINRDMKPTRDKSRDKDRDRRSRDKDDGHRSHKDRDDERKHRRDGDDSRQKDGDRRHRNKDTEERRRDKDGERRHREKDGEDRRHRDHEERPYRDKDGEDRRHRDRDGERRHRDKDEERRHRDKDDERKHRDRDGERRHKDKEDDRRHRDKNEERRHRDKDGERKHRDDEERKHRDREDDRRHRDKNSDERRNREKEGEERKHRDRNSDDRRHRDKEGERRTRDGDKDRERRDKDRERKDRDKERKEETEEERERRKKEERRQRRKEEEKRRQEEKAREEEERRRKEEEAKQAAALAAEDAKDDGYDDYEDDFEAYDDDFEDSESIQVNEKNKEMADILRAMSVENDGVSRHHGSHRGGSATSSSGAGEVPTTRAAPKSFINFVSARTRQADAEVANRTRQRSRELLRLIHLDSTSYEMFELAEMEEYRLYMRRFGSAAASQVACQTHEDALERETQCDPIERRSVWTQQPPDDLAAAGDSEEDKKVEPEIARTQEVLQSRSLFNSAQLILRLLEEEARPHMAPPQGQERGSGLFNGHTAMKSPLDSSPTFIEFCSTRPSLVLSLHSSLPSHVCMWNVTAPREPQEILESPSKALCVRFSPLGSSLVFAGCEDGSLVMWDIREPRAWHGGRNRAPTFVTAAVLEEENHSSPVIDIRALTAAAPFGQAPTAFQMASLDVSGVVQLWVTSQLVQADPAGSEADLGLRPGGRVRLGRAARLQPAPLLAWSAGLARKVPGTEGSACFAPSSEPGAFLVGSELGVIHHVARTGARLHPRRYLLSSPSPVSSLDLSPFGEPFFIAGYADGSVRIFHISHDVPLLEFSEFGEDKGVVQVAWSRSRPAVCFALDATGNIFVWDLLVEETRPVRKETPGKSQGRVVTRISLSDDHNATGRGERGRKPQMGLCFADGLEVHELSEGFCVGDLDETYQVSNLLQSFI